VAKQNQKKGIASELVSKALETARDLRCKDVILEVRHGNEAAKKLYKKFGFVEAGRRKAYYPKAKEDALIYRLAVK
jgi:ribosomal-protein-alanine N-acetyltransferase